MLTIVCITFISCSGTKVFQAGMLFYITKDIIVYGADGFDKNGFNSKGIHKTTKLEWNTEGFNQEDNHKIFVALDKKNCIDFNNLLKNNLNIQNNNGVTTLMVASSVNSCNSVKILINNKVNNLNEQDNKGYTALMYASLYGHYDAIQILILNGANSKIKNNKGKTALNIASKNNYKYITQLLLNQ